ncbi:SDR family oxidoreductase [Lactococcus formosensis]|uniref:SDR family oxidoreductase n=1 Tax=Lactococcus formosensis TaxID=1281486 RepID=UPI0007CB9984|nr:SDR family oxidoreductase [Lactococcus formosensis]BAV01646.1 putative sugar epimerase YhfK [Lactococcus formosensis]BDW49421.1 oxidoreductase [Lactococcus formosensis]BDX25005.1 oxidoreductase [Lactococcus formosensis]
MKVLIVGANGKVAKHLAESLKDYPEIQERAVIRKEEQQEYFNQLGIETVVLDIVNNSIEEFTAVMSDVDAIVFSAGAGGAGLDKTIMIDLDGAVKIMTASEKANVKRFIMVSTFRVGREEITRQIQEDSSLKIYTIAKHYADEWLKTRTELDWTIIHPGILTDKESTGKVTLASHVETGEIPREDVAKVILETLKNDATIKKEFEVVSGDTKIYEAIKNLND